jgi:hypothetical protein
MNLAEDKAVANYFCTDLPVAFNMQPAGLYGKNCNNIPVVESTVPTIKVKSDCITISYKS